MELGILFTGGEGPAPEKAAVLVREAGASLIAAADSGLISAEAAGIKPDLIIGDFDSLDDGGRLAAYKREQIRSYPVDKDYTDTELALSALRESGCGRVWIIGGGGGRLDHLLAIRSFFERDNPPERWITAKEDIRCIQSPGVLEVSNEGGGRAPLGPVSVFPVGKSGSWKAGSRGLKWPLTGLVWNRGFFGVSNEAPDGVFSIYAEKGSFLVILPL
jgi:thiamine pyrophosphokinase